MRRSLVTITLLLLAGIAHADGRAQPGDADRLIACLGEVGAHPADRLRCVNDVVNPCMNDLTRTTAEAVNDCIRRETAAWVEVMAPSEAALAALLPDDRRQALTESQAAWSAFIEADCRGLYPYDSAQTDRLEALTCVLDHTAARAIALHRRLQIADGLAD